MKSILKSYIRLKTKPLSDEKTSQQSVNKPEPQNVEQVPIKQEVQTDPFNGRKLSLGDYLQEARVSSGQTIHQVSQITKIHTHYLEAIEREDFANTPPSIYVRAYIKRLSDLYKIDPTRALAMYEAHVGEPETKLPETLALSLEETKLPNTKQEEKIRHYIKYGSIALGVLIVIVVIISLIAAFTGGGNSIEDKPLTAEQKIQLSSDMEKLLSPQTLEAVALKPETTR